MSKHTVSVSLEDKDYEALRALAKEQDRYINEQARHMLRTALHKPLAERIGEVLEDLHADDFTQPGEFTQPTGPHTQEPLPG